MRKHSIQILLILTALSLSAIAADRRAGAAALDGADAPVPTPVTIAAPSLKPRLTLATDRQHPALMETFDGAVEPGAAVTRAALCGYLAPLLDGLPEGGPAAVLEAEGLLPWDGPADGSVVSKRELSDILSRLAERLGGGERAAARALASELSVETSPLTRGVLAVTLERLLDREPNEAGLLVHGLLPTDVRPTDDNWAYIADAVHAGAVPPAPAGIHRVYGWLYAVWDDGSLVKDMDYGVWTFGLDGRYTTGDGELDGYLAETLAACGADALPYDEALERVYLYVKNNYEYLLRPEDIETLEVGAFGWEYERALRFFRYGGGPCYGYAAAFGLLARALGANAYIVSGEVNQYYGAHSFVVIPEDGTDLIYDVELEANRPERHGDLALFSIRNHTVYDYWYETDWADP